jgi:hypothetical protein
MRRDLRPSLAFVAGARAAERLGVTLAFLDYILTFICATLLIFD